MISRVKIELSIVAAFMGIWISGMSHAHAQILTNQRSSIEKPDLAASGFSSQENIRDKKTKKEANRRHQKPRAHRAMSANFSASTHVNARDEINNTGATRLTSQRQDIDYTPIGAVPAEFSTDPTALAKGFCAAISQPLIEAKARWTSKKLHELEAELQIKITEVNAKIEELRALEERHADAVKKADENVVAIYAKMKPEAAAAQMAVMDETLAAAILTKLNIRAASTVLNEISADKAARITNFMSNRNMKNVVQRTPL